MTSQSHRTGPLRREQPSGAGAPGTRERVECAPAGAPHAADVLSRREAILRVGVLLGGATLVGQAALLAGCATVGAPRATAVRFTREEIALLDEVAETILPETGTPGAKAAGVGPFMARMVAEAYDERARRIFRDGMRTLDKEAVRTLGFPFMAATAEGRLVLIERLDREQFEHQRTRAPGGDAHYFRMMKELALSGYFTSEIGYRQAMRYIETPGRFDPCVPYAPGEKAWAPHA
jgi:hypothetical protein